MSASGSPPSPASPRAPSSRARRRVVAIGNFDGVHRGHQAVLERAARIADDSECGLAVLTFDPHPRQVLLGQRLPVLTTPRRKLHLLQELGLGIEPVVVPFSRELAEQSPEEFCRDILKEQLESAHVLVGSNFRFGKNRAGDLDTLVELGQRLGFQAGAEPLFGDGDGAFSSTRIRELVTRGDVGRAADLLGRPHLISGQVVVGDQRGREWGFPTANLARVDEVLPADGVYAVRVFDGTTGALLRPGVLNVGARPTVERPHAIEVHLFDFSSDLYGQNLAVELIERVRPVRRFDGVEELRRQIARDAERARRVCQVLPTVTTAPGWRAVG